MHLPQSSPSGIHHAGHFPETLGGLTREKNDMQIAVIGAGNIGCVYGANLARIGEQVTLIDVWVEHIDRIRAHGLHLEGLNGDFIVSVGATVAPAEAPKADAVLICANAYNTPEAARSAKAVLKEGGYEATEAVTYSSLPSPFAPSIEERIIGRVHELVRATQANRSP